MASVERPEPIDPALYENVEAWLASCTICNGPLYSEAELRAYSYNDRDWVAEIVLLTDISLKCVDAAQLQYLPRCLLQRDRPIKRCQATSKAGTYFSLGEEDGRIVASLDATGDHHPQLYIPVHEACLTIIDEFIATRQPAPSPMAGPWTVSKIWDVVRLRLEAEARSGPVQPCRKLREPHQYYQSYDPIGRHWEGDEIPEWTTDPTRDSPLGLRNRERIWKILNAMRPGDVRPRKINHRTPKDELSIELNEDDEAVQYYRGLSAP